MTDQNRNDLLAFAEAVAHEAGEIMRDYFYRDDQDVHRKENNTIVTEADLKVNRLVIQRVAETFPTHGVLGEEESDGADRPQLWVCDPIDGTNGFTTGLPTAVFSLAYVEDGRPVVAVVYNPFVDELYKAVVDGGATCNGRPMQVSGRQLPGVVVAGPGGMKELEKRLPAYRQLVSDGAVIRNFGGMVYQCCLVARGRVDGRLFPGRGAHDIAAAKLIVEEAGGRVTDLAGEEQRYDRNIKGAVISNGLIHDDLLRAVALVGADEFLGY